MKFLKRNPFFRLLLPWIAGLMVQKMYPGMIWAIVSIAILSIIYLVLDFSNWYHDTLLFYPSRWKFGVAVNLLVFSLAWLNADIQKMESALPLSDELVLAEITESPVVKEKRIELTARWLNVRNTSKVNIQLVVLKDSGSEAVHLYPGDKILIRGKPVEPSGPMNPDGYDAKRYLSTKGILYTVFVHERELTVIKNTSNTFSLQRVAEGIRLRMMKVFDEVGLTGQPKAVLVALVIGKKDALDQEVKSDFTGAGAMHVLAVSGLHVGILYFVFSSFLNVVFKSKKWIVLKQLLIIMFLWSYAIIAGMSPSVNRASAMFSLVSLGVAFSHKSLIYNTLSLTAFVLLYFNTNALYDVGFQLSFAAVVGIIYFQPLIKKRYEPKNRIVKWVWDLTTVSLAAQIGTFPLSVYYFNQFPTYFLISNLVIIPLTTFIIYGVILLLASSFWPALSVVVGKVLGYLLNLTLGIVAWFNSLPYSVLNFSYTGLQSVLVYLVVVAVAWWMHSKSYKSVVLILVSLLLIAFVDVYKQLILFRESKIIVYSDKRDTHIEFIEGLDTKIISTNPLNHEKISKKFHLKNYITKIKYVQPDSNWNEMTFNFKDKKILVLASQEKHKRKAVGKFKTDFLILTKGFDYNSLGMMKEIDFEQCVIESGVRKGLVNKIKNSCKERKKACYSCAENGAYIQNFFVIL